MSRPRWMALCFALGSTCFLIGPFPGYAQLVGDSADAITFFIGSILFTAGGTLQSWLAWSERRCPGGGRAAWWAAIVQSAGTLFFNVTTYQAMHTVLTSPRVQQARLAAGLARVDLLPRLRRDRLPSLGASWLVAGARWGGLVAAGREPARLHLLRNLGCRRLRRSVDRVDARPGGGQLEHIAGCGVLPRLCARHLAHRQSLEDATTAGGSVSSSTSSRPTSGRSALRAQREFTEPEALLSTRPADLPLPRRTVGLSFDLLALRARCVAETMDGSRPGQDRRESDSRSLRSSSRQSVVVWTVPALAVDLVSTGGDEDEGEHEHEHEREHGNEPTNAQRHPNLLSTDAQTSNLICGSFRHGVTSSRSWSWSLGNLRACELAQTSLPRHRACHRRRRPNTFAPSKRTISLPLRTRRGSSTICTAASSGSPRVSPPTPPGVRAR